jgi:hypothetical protein
MRAALKEEHEPKMEQQRSFEFQLHTHLPFSNWYHAHLPIFWVISHIAVNSDEPAIFWVHNM